MTTITNILIPVDLRNETPAVLDYARLLGKQFNATLHLITVIPGAEQLMGAEIDISWYDKHEQELRTEVDKAMEAFIASKFSGSGNVRSAVAIGDVVDEILRYAKANSCDLIVMGTHGRRGVTRIFFGSVAEGVVRRARCPVLTLHPFD